MSGFTGRARRRAVAVIPVFALAATGLVSFGATGAVAAESPVSPPVISDSEYYMNYVAPRLEGQFDTDGEVLVDGATAKSAPQVQAEAEAFDQKYSQGNPIAAKGLATLEAKSIATGKNPKELKKPKHDKKPKKTNFKQAESTQEAKLLTILVEFDENANDDFTGTYVPTEFGSKQCKLGNVQNGPTHNGIPNPADYSSRTTTRCGCPTSRRSTSTRCSSPTKASPIECAPTSPVPTASPASTSRATR